MISWSLKYFFVFLFIIFSNPAFANSCPKKSLRNLLESLSRKAPAIAQNSSNTFKAMAQTKTSDEIFWLRRFARNARDGFRRFLQVHGTENYYPATNPADAPKANYWARHSLNILGSKKNDSINIEEITTELLADIAFIKDFPRIVLEYAAEAATLTSKKIALQNLDYKKVIQMKYEVPHDFFIPDTKTPGALLSVKGKTPFTTEAHFDIEMNRVFPWFPRIQTSVEQKELLKKAKKRARDQADRVAKIFIYYSEFFRLSRSTIQTNLTSDPALLNAIKELESIFEPGTLTTKADFRVSEDAIQWLRLKQLLTEIHMTFRNIKVAGLKDFIQSLPEKEKQFLGTENLYEKLKWWEIWKKTKWSNLILFAGVPAGGGLSAWVYIYKFVYHDEIEREKCALKSSEDEFLECAFEYLKIKAQTRKLFFSQKEFASLLDEDGTITDPVLVAEMSEITALRNAYIFSTKWSEGIKPIFTKEIQTHLLGSEAFLRELINKDNTNEFKNILISNDPSEGFLMFNFPIAFSIPGIQNLVGSILDAENDEEQKELLTQLGELESTKSLTQALTSVLEARKEFLKAKDLASKESFKISLQNTIQIVSPLLKK